MRKFFKLFVVPNIIINVVIFLVGFRSDIPVEELKTKYAYPDSKFIEIEGMDMHYRKTGSGPTLLLLHGVASSLHTWEAWHKELSDDFTVISIDVPGFGLTGPIPSGEYSVESYMNIVDQFLEKQGIENCSIAGNSFGGYLAWNYALHKPEKTDRLVLLDPMGTSDSEPLKALGWVMRNLQSLGIYAYGIPLIKDMARYITPRFAVAQTVKGVYGDDGLLTAELVDRYHELFLRDGNRKAFGEIGIKLWKEKNVKQKHQNIIQPTLIMWGEEDIIFPVKEAYLFKENISQAEIKVYPGLGHVPMEESPVSTANDAREFLLKSSSPTEDD